MTQTASNPEWIVDRSGESRAVLDIIGAPESRMAVVRGSHGGQLHLPLGDLDGDGATWQLPADWSDIERSEAVMPLVHEEVSIDKRLVERGRVRVRKVIREEQEVVDQPLLHEEAVVERIRVDRFVDERPQTRREGDVLVVPCVEEVLVVEKRLLLREEIRVRIERTERNDPQEVTVRREEVVIERDPEDGAH